MKISVHELKQIQLNRQHLTAKSDKITVCRDLNGLQAQIMVNVFHSLKIRCGEKITKQNFGGGLVKNWTVRGTVHAFAADDLGLFMYETDRRPYRSEEWKGCISGITGEWIISPERQGYFSHIILDSLKERIRTRDELKELCISRGITNRELNEMFCPWGGGMQYLCSRGFIYYVVQEKKAFALCPPFEPMNGEEAKLEMMRRYFTHIAPATVKDAAYYFDWSQTYVKEAMQKLPLMQIETDGKTYYYLEELKSDYPDIPRCILLAGFDQLMLGYQKKESMYLSRENLRGIFNLAGIILPPVLLDGKIVGKWQKKNSKLTFTLFESILEKDKQAIIQAGESLWDDIKKIEWQ